ncbi:hypothetical protein MSPP1_000718 [Malassezia sp. CBS 17886]|nr:hypothetical protein MSPP1_000718 [Malassezia sp. CBS 17886]
MAQTRQTVAPEPTVQDDLQVLDETEQDIVIDDIRRSNEKSNYVYRAALLVVYALVVVLFLIPVPAYLRGKHPRSHLALFIHHHQTVGTEDDLTYLPAFPVYAFAVSMLMLIIYGAARELLDAMRLLSPRAVPYPAQPHPYGTAPSWLAPVLSDIRLQPSRMSHRNPDQPPQKVSLSIVIPPRLVYVGFLWVCSWPIPLLTFGMGAFSDAAWFAFPFFALTVHLLIEWWIYRADRDATGLAGMKYNYKGA